VKLVAEGDYVIRVYGNAKPDENASTVVAVDDEIFEYLEKREKRKRIK
jgi:hypothetical protein